MRINVRNAGFIDELETTLNNIAADVETNGGTVLNMHAAAFHNSDRNKTSWTGYIVCSFPKLASEEVDDD